jgi:hypothetical protein
LYKRARYYDPNTGEFVSRDPLEYVDGMSQYRGYFVPDTVDPLGLTRWTTRDFLLHYWFGFGATVSLNSVGLGSAYWEHPSVAKQLDKFECDLDKQIQGGWQGNNSDSCSAIPGQTYLVQRNDTVSTDVTDTIFVVGDSSGLKLSASCTVTISDCDENCCREYSADCSFDYFLKDFFRDPLDFEENGFPNVEVGIPYAITASLKWDSVISGSTCEFKGFCSEE